MTFTTFEFTLLQKLRIINNRHVKILFYETSNRDMRASQRAYSLFFPFFISLFLEYFIFLFFYRIYRALFPAYNEAAFVDWRKCCKKVPSHPRSAIRLAFAR